MAALRGDISFRYLKQFFLVISLNKLAVLIFTSLKKINNCSLRHFYKFDEKRARTPRWVIGFTSKLQ
jgi:hypothetical protein